MAKMKCNVKACLHEFSRYGRYNIHEHEVGKLSITHELQQWFCGLGHENWESKAW